MNDKGKRQKKKDQKEKNKTEEKKRKPLYSHPNHDTKLQYPPHPRV